MAMDQVDAELQASSNGRQDDVVIAVMGSTGTGKSSFIQLLSGSTAVKIGNDLESETSEVQPIPFVDPASGRNILIVDTPGFDDSRAGVSDTEILRKITNFLVQQYDEQKKLNGLVFVQRISDPRFGGQSGRNLKMLKNLCGTTNYKNVIVLTTFWDRVDEEEGVKRESQLQSSFFKDLVAGGAQFMRHDRSAPDDVHKVLEQIIPMESTDVQIVKEIREEGKSLEDTAAGSVRREEVEALIAKHKSEVSDLQKELRAVKEGNEAVRKELEAERDALKQQLSRWEKERADLREGLENEKNSRERLEKAAEEENEKHEKWREEQERNWNDKLTSQTETHSAQLKDMEAKLDQERKTRADEEVERKQKETLRLVTDERRKREAAERALEAEHSKTHYQRAKETVKDLNPIARALLGPRMLIEGKILDVAKGVTK